MVQDPEIPRYMSIPRNHSVEGVRTWLASRDEDLEAGRNASVAIVDAAGSLVGSVSLELSCADQAIGEVGYWVAAEVRGQGVATAAVRLVSEWAFRTLGLARLEITTHEDNIASQHVARANGFLREGVLRAYRLQHGERVDLVMFSRLRTDPSR
jgi:RimJ/RimL family protein N-acetyltransferase